MSNLNQTRPNSPFRGFGARAEAPKTEGSSEKKKSEFYINIGYPVESIHPLTQEPTTTFVALQQGIGLDFVTEIDPTKEKSQFAADLAVAKNQLREYILDVAKDVEPGGSTIFMMDEVVGLCCEIKRVRGDQTPSGENPFKRTFERR